MRGSPALVSRTDTCKFLILLSVRIVLEFRQRISSMYEAFYYMIVFCKDSCLARKKKGLKAMRTNVTPAPWCEYHLTHAHNPTRVMATLQSWCNVFPPSFFSQNKEDSFVILILFRNLIVT